MANKQVNELTEKDKVEGNDLHPVYDSSEAGSEKLKKTSLQDVAAPKWVPSSHTGTGTSPQPVCLNGVVAPLVNVGGSGKASVSVADFLVSVVHNENNPLPGGGGPPYTYGIQKVGDVSWNDNTDPLKATYDFSCSDLGTVLVRIRVFDQVGNWTYCECYVLVQDPMSVCGAP